VLGPVYVGVLSFAMGLRGAMVGVAALAAGFARCSRRPWPADPRPRPPGLSRQSPDRGGSRDAHGRHGRSDLPHTPGSSRGPRGLDHDPLRWTGATIWFESRCGHAEGRDGAM